MHAVLWLKCVCRVCVLRMITSEGGEMESQCILGVVWVHAVLRSGCGCGVCVIGKQ